MNKITITIGIAICVFVLGGCASVPIGQSPVYQKVEGSFYSQVISNLSNEGSGELSGQGAPLSFGENYARFCTASLLGDKQLNNYLEGIVKQLLAGTPWQDMSYHVVVVVDKSYSAYSYPDGTIVLTLPLLLEINSEDELAMILGHEMSHVILKHHKSDWFVDYQKSIVGAGDVSLDIFKGIQKQVPKAEEVNTNDAKKVLRRLSVVKQVSTDVVFPSWLRTQEQEADLLGFDLMVKAGYNLDEAFAVFDKLNQLNQKVEAEEKLIDQLEDTLSAQVGTLLAGEFSLDSLKKTGEEIFLDPFKKKLKRDHPEYDKRVEFLLNYCDREYASVDYPTPAQKAWDKLVNNKTRQSRFAIYKSAFAIDSQVKTGDTEGAVAAKDKLEESAFKKDPYIQQVLAGVLQAEGKTVKAIAALEVAVSDSRCGYPVYDELANLLGSAGHPGKAAEILAKADGTFEAMPAVQVGRIYWTRQSGDTKEATKMTYSCKLKYPDFATQCEEKNEAEVVAHTKINIKGSQQNARSLSRGDIKSLQVILNNLGYSVGNPDGLIGPRTAEGIKKFQKKNGLDCSGKFDSETVIKLHECEGQNKNKA